MPFDEWNYLSAGYYILSSVVIDDLLIGQGIEDILI